MTQTRTRPRRDGIHGFLDGFRGVQNVDVDPSAIDMSEPTPFQTMYGLTEAFGRTTTQSSSEGTSLTMENVERIVAQVTASPPQSESNRTATELQLQRNATRQINQGIQEVNRTTSPDARWSEITIDDVEMTSVPVPTEEASKLFLKDKDWEKIYRSRKPIEEKISHILVHSQNKVSEIQKTLDQTENRHRDIRKAVREAAKQTKDLTRDIRELKKRKKELESETEEQKKLRATRVIQDILALPKVKKIEVDEKKRIFITTDDMEVMKDYWDKPRVAGQYQILVDFYETSIRQGIRVLNITKRLLDQYDHPCIKDTNPCWGNIQNEIEESFKERDLLEIVITMLLYISSPNDDTGWIEYSKKPPTERHKQGWEQFLEFATPCPKNFSFRKYEKQQSRRPNNTGLTTDGATTPSLRAYATTLGGMASPAQFVPPQLSRLPSLIVPSDAIDNTEFIEIFKRYLRLILEFRDPEGEEQCMRAILHNLEGNGILFIKKIKCIMPDILGISGWTIDGWGQIQNGLSMEGIHIQNTEVLRFDPPSWFRDVGTLGGSEYYNQYMQPTQAAQQQ